MAGRNAALSVCTAPLVDTHDMTATPPGVVETLVTEITTEAATAEIAIWTLTGAGLLVAASSLAQRSARRADDRTAATGWAATRVAAMIAAFSILTVHVLRSGWLTGADAATLQWFVAHRAPGWTTLAIAVTTVGGPAGVAAIAVVLAAIVAIRRHTFTAAIMILGPVAVASAASTLTKLTVGRERPPAAFHLMTETDFSFPSGHVTATTALVGALLVSYLRGPKFGEQSGSAAKTFALVVAAIATVVAVAVTRLYLGVHWLTDVVGGVLLGATAVLATVLVSTALQGRANLLHRVEASAMTTMPRSDRTPVVGGSRGLQP